MRRETYTQQINNSHSSESRSEKVDMKFFKEIVKYFQPMMNHRVYLPGKRIASGQFLTARSNMSFYGFA